jgi:hypothetical protein
MGFDQRALQLLLNVVVVTGITSLTLLWYLRRRDHQKVSAELKLRLEQPPLPTLAARTERAPEERGEAEFAPVLDTLPSGDQDIRRYVARRSREWSPKATA